MRDIVYLWCYGVIDCFVLVYGVSKMFGPMKRAKKIPWILFFIAVAFYGALWPSANPYDMLVAEAAGIMCIMPFFEKNFSKKFLLSFTLLAISISWSFIFWEVDYQVAEEWVRNSLAAAGHIGYCLLILLISHMAEKREETFRMSAKNAAVLMIMPLIMLISNISMRLYVTPSMTDAEINRLVNYVGITENVALIIMGVLLFYIYGEFEKKQSEFKRKVLMEQQIHIQADHFMEMEEMQNSLRSFRHDVRNNLNMLGYFADRDDSEGIKEVLRGLNVRMESPERVISTGNSVIDGILNFKISEAFAENIRVDTDISIPAGMNLDYEMSITILGNLLDNAIEAAARVVEDDRRIFAGIKYVDGMLCVRIENPCVEQDSKKGIFRTTKKDSGKHGMGLANVRMCVQKLGGAFEARREQGTFTAELVLYNVQQNQK